MNKCMCCEEETDNKIGDCGQDRLLLCNDCCEGYNQNGNTTGYCSLDCCVTGRCDHSC
jgi:hypothetical protein